MNLFQAAIKRLHRLIAASPLIAPVKDSDYLELQDEDISFVLSERLWEEVLPRVRQARVILDVGCGVGTLLHNVAKEAGTEALIVGLTLDYQHCVLAQRFVRNAKVVCSDALKTPFRDKVTPLIFSTMLIEHVDDNMLVGEMARLLTHGGTLVLSTVLRGTGAIYFYRDENGASLLAPDHLREYSSIDEVLRLLHKNGFTVTTVQVVPIRFSPLDGVFHSLYRLTRIQLLKSVAKWKVVTCLRKMTRLAIPRYYVVEIIAQT